jgi:5,10-methylenetetrahydrofolate reductase
MTHAADLDMTHAAAHATMKGVAPLAPAVVYVNLPGGGRDIPHRSATAAAGAEALTW